MAGFCGVCGMRLDDGLKNCPDCGAIVGGQRKPQDEPELFMDTEPGMDDRKAGTVKFFRPKKIGGESAAVLAISFVLLILAFNYSLWLGAVLAPLLLLSALSIVYSIELKRVHKRLSSEDKMLQTDVKTPKYIVRGRLED